MTDVPPALNRRALLRAITTCGALAASAAMCQGCGVLSRAAGGGVASSTVASTTTAPGTLVMIIRHGEKPTGSDKGFDPSGQWDKSSLTLAGYQRAGRLVNVFDPPQGPPRPGLARPTLLYAAGANDDGEGKRTRQTLAPLARRLGLSVNTNFGKGEEGALVADVISRPGPALICWQHGEIPAIAEAFGDVSPTPPSEWPDERYDLVWTLTASTQGWNIAQIPEMVMPGDEAAVIDG
jgi:hypothetical protein